MSGCVRQWWRPSDTALWVCTKCSEKRDEFGVRVDLLGVASPLDVHRDCVSRDVYDKEKRYSELLRENTNIVSSRRDSELRTLDRAYRFICGLQLQDHPIKEQREREDLAREMRALLRKDGER